MKGRERQMIDKSNAHEIIPISFDMNAILKDRYYNMWNESRYLVQTYSQAKDSRIKLPEVHGVDKGIKSWYKTRKTGIEISKFCKQTQNRTR